MFLSHQGLLGFRPLLLGWSDFRRNVFGLKISPKFFLYNFAHFSRRGKEHTVGHKIACSVPCDLRVAGQISTSRHCLDKLLTDNFLLGRQWETTSFISSPGGLYKNVPAIIIILCFECSACFDVFPTRPTHELSLRTLVVILATTTT